MAVWLLAHLGVGRTSDSAGGPHIDGIPATDRSLRARDWALNREGHCLKGVSNHWGNRIKNMNIWRFLISYTLELRSLFIPDGNVNINQLLFRKKIQVMKKENDPGTCHHLIINAALVNPRISITKCLLVHLQQGLCVREYLKNTRKGNQLFHSFFYSTHL